MHCSNCSSLVSKNDRFCGECGNQLQTNSQPSESPSNNNEKVAVFKQNVTQYSSNIFAEGKTFFQSIFTKLDSEIESTRTFSYKFIATLLGIGLILLLIFSSILIPTEISYLGISKGSTVAKLFFFAIIGLIVLFAITVGINKILNIKTTIHKTLSDFISFNTYATLLFFIGAIFLLIQVPSFAIFLIIVSLLLFIISPIYLFTKYSSSSNIRIPVVYGILIYFIIIAIIMRIIVESSISSTINLFQSYLGV
ncbi:zinc ribbon domain-containing protein [Staphylococcus xylosus]|uniref:zinc ribbon domain-containing protein n=1 Tax=Staphylococcus xylosus TaxID=1288 RepID=UPI000D1D4BDD|nr:zinc ribbon domain-containing protein [Staphylococcus xylosus]PTH97073.1 zinc ribbon domain-containing protein [Staphylococcus xylosus]